MQTPNQLCHLAFRAAGFKCTTYGRYDEVFCLNPDGALLSSIAAWFGPAEAHCRARPWKPAGDNPASIFDEPWMRRDAVLKIIQTPAHHLGSRRNDPPEDALIPNLWLVHAPMVKVPLSAAASPSHTVWFPRVDAGFDREIFGIPARRPRFFELALRARDAGAPSAYVHACLNVALERAGNGVNSHGYRVKKGARESLPLVAEAYETLLADPGLEMLETRVELMSARRGVRHSPPLIDDGALGVAQLAILHDLQDRNGRIGQPLERLWCALCATGHVPDGVESDFRETHWCDIPGLSLDGIRMEIQDKTTFEHLMFAVDQDHRGFAALERHVMPVDARISPRGTDLPAPPVVDPDPENDPSSKAGLLHGAALTRPVDYRREVIEIGLLATSNSEVLRAVRDIQDRAFEAHSLEAWNTALDSFASGR